MRSTVDSQNEGERRKGKSRVQSDGPNGTLWTEEIVDFLSENRIGVTVSMEGDKELNDRKRVFTMGKGSYDVPRPEKKLSSC